MFRFAPLKTIRTLFVLWVCFCLMMPLLAQSVATIRAAPIRQDPAQAPAKRNAPANEEFKFGTVDLELLETGKSSRPAIRTRRSGLEDEATSAYLAGLVSHYCRAL